MKQIVILANKYPNDFDPNINVFTQQTAWTFADLGYECVVICPAAINLNLTNYRLPIERTEHTERGNSVRVIRPRYFSMGQRPGPLNKLRVSFTVAQYIGATKEAIRHFAINPLVLFGEFLCPCGVAAAQLGSMLGVPSFFQHGEAMYFGDRYFGNSRLRDELLRDLTGAVAVSTQNKGYLINSGILPSDKIGIFPNGCRSDRFFPRNKHEARKRMGWPDDAFIVGMTGTFDERKGVMRLKRAVEQLDGVYYACAGKGPLDPSGKRCLLSSPVDNADLPWYLSALDAFVLPTHNEGCCTAIVEAISCGLPIISSNKSFNFDICDQNNSILVDPDDTALLSDAIARLRDDESLRIKLCEGSLIKASSVDLMKRVKCIVSWMDDMIDDSFMQAKL